MLKPRANIGIFLRKNIYLLVAAAWLITFSFIIDTYFAEESSVRVMHRHLNRHIAECESDFLKTTSDSRLMERLALGLYPSSDMERMSGKDYFLFLYANPLSAQRLVYWNTQTVEPTTELLQQTDSVGFARLANGFYVWLRSRTGPYTALSLIPIKWNYPITNEYLVNSFATGNTGGHTYDLTESRLPLAVVSREGRYLFSLGERESSSIEHNNRFAAILRILGSIIFLLFIHLAAANLAKISFRLSVLMLVTVVVFLRLACYRYPIPLDFRQYELFNPAMYGSQQLIRSLGDLLINSGLLLWIVLFIRHFLQVKKISLPLTASKFRWLYVSAGIALLLASTFLTGHIIRALVADSSISFDVINFFTLNSYTLFGFLVLGSVSVGYFFFSQIIIYVVQPLLPKNIYALLLLIGTAGLSYLSFRTGTEVAIFELCLLLWLLAYLLLLNNRRLFFLTSKIISSRLIFWLFFFSLSIAGMIIAENKQQELTRRKSYARTLAEKADPAGERLLNSSLLDFRNEVLAPLFDLFRDPKKNRQIKDSLLSQNFSGYLNKYDTRIYTFDKNKTPLFNGDTTEFLTLATLLKTQGKPTGVPGLYYFDESYDQFTYISRREITDTSGENLGYLFILASPKKVKSDALYPELFLKGYNNSIENSPMYSYAVYNKLQLIEAQNDYAFPFRLLPGQIPKADFSLLNNNGYEELWLRTAGEKVVIIAKKNNYLLQVITLFSYLFCSFLLVTGLFWLLSTLIRTRLKADRLREVLNLSIRNQVHGAIILLSLLGFLLLGAATVYFFVDRSQNNSREKLSRTIQVIQNEIRESVNNLSMVDDVIKIYDLNYRENLEQTVSRIAELHGIDVNIYDLDGNLQVSSLPLPYTKGIVSSRMEPRAYFHLHVRNEIQHFSKERIGLLEYLSNYVPIIDSEGKPYAYLQIPYFTSQTKLRQEISNFLVAIINLNAFIFLLAGIVALFIANRITDSFTFISGKMKEVNLGRRNEAIVWNRRDEIHELVEEYNTMLAKLEESAASLAKSEREGAWREMARQVAHEIKNPLTPMKLSLQHLQNAIDKNDSQVKELTRKVATTLVEQIDHLSRIAGDFSQFANLGLGRPEEIDLAEVLSSLVQLHRLQQDVTLHYDAPKDPIFIRADKTQLNRLFTNLLQNAIQSIPTGKQGFVDVKADVEEGQAVITISDNGCGIPDELKEKIFTPNFTTKSSGTGLGLAMCMGIVEQLQGKISFITKENTGTRFRVSIPVH